MEIAYNTVLEMLCDRGYNVDSLSRNYTSHISLPDIIVYFKDSPKLGVSQVKDIVQDARGNKNVIIIHNGTCTSFAKQVIETTDTLRVETFTVDELSFNVTKHKLVPKHRMLSNEEKNTLLCVYNTTCAKLPRIKQNDPVVRYYGAVPGVVFEITRNSETSGITKYYRIVT